MAGNEPEAPRDLTATVVRGAGLAGAGYLLAQALNLATYVVLARLIAPKDFGDFAAATILLSLTLLVTESGLASAVIQRREGLEAAAATAVVATAVTGTAMSLLMLGASPLVGLFFGSSRVTALAAAASGTVFLRTIAAVPDALLQRRFSFLRRLVIEPALVVAFGVTAVVLASVGLGPWALVIAQYVGYAVDASLAWMLVGWRPDLRLASYRVWRELVGYGRHVFVATSILRIGDQASAAIVGRSLGTAALGQFRYAGRLAGTPFAMLLAAAAYVLFPAFSRIAHEEERLRRAFMRSLRWVCVAAFPSGLVFVPLGVPTAVLVFGRPWRAAGEALAAMCLLPAGGMLSSVVSEALKAIGEPRYLTRLHLVTTLVTAGSVLALYPFGLTAAAAGVSIGAVVGGLYAVVLMSRVGNASLAAMLREVAPAAVAAATAAAVLVPLERLVVHAESHGELLGLVLLAGEALAGAALYLLLLRLLAPETARELRAAARIGLRRLAGARGRARAAAA